MEGGGMKLLRAHRWRTVRVFMDGMTFEGELVEATGEGVVLREAVALVPDGVGVTSRQKMKGPVVVAAASIAWTEVVES